MNTNFQNVDDMRTDRKENKKKYRVFISYSHQDQQLADCVEGVLRNTAQIMWDKEFRFGHGFHDQIKCFIAHSHVFVPIITENSSQRGWVHQEIGYAMALNIPVLPITFGKQPGEMIQQILAVRLTGEDVEQWERQLKDHLRPEILHNLVGDFGSRTFARFQCADQTEDRAKLIASYADDVRKLGYHGLVRQKGALSSFHIPYQSISNPIWKQRYGDFNISPYRCDLQRKERLALEKHALLEGCRLIIDPSLSYSKYGPSARRVRLECLVKFLEAMSNDLAQIGISEPKIDIETSITIVGDWFLAEAVSAAYGRGYRQTIFTRHAPSMMDKIEQFDQEFHECLQRTGWDTENSREEAISYLNKIIQELKA